MLSIVFGRMRRAEKTTPLSIKGLMMVMVLVAMVVMRSPPVS